MIKYSYNHGDSMHDYSDYVANVLKAIAQPRVALSSGKDTIIAVKAEDSSKKSW